MVTRGGGGARLRPPCCLPPPYLVEQQRPEVDALARQAGPVDELAHLAHDDGLHGGVRLEQREEEGCGLGREAACGVAQLVH